MKAIITTRYGSPEVLQIKEVEKPHPRKNEVLIQVRAIAVTSGDCRLRAFNPPNLISSIPMRLMIGIFKPRRPIQGLWLAGVIEETAESVNQFKIGQPVYARTLDLKFGANAEYVCLPENAIIGLKPGSLTFEEAVSIPFGGLSALHFLKKSNINKGDTILIYGASGSVGTSAIQLANYFGAEVTAVCSTENMEWVKKLGVDKTIDYKKEQLTNCKDRFDIVFDAVGYIDRSVVKRLLKPTGNFVSVIHSGHAQSGVKELNFLTDLVEKGQLKPVIDKCYSFEEMIEAHRYVDKGHKKGNVVIKVNEK
ncbi:NAD(P)-dependent alcohol dehydrogenase [Gorillibacterium massiliense]|uniref:NAD(P)-dependent alcohol dehydrogenase n=1 Tax=Gorillibacterium massiliense TaxID=1280390 RepID=UPI000594427F|nr:NAD(P)-dependent alcohol dehydrogenase [Gorillibacterium massiliense]